MLKFAPIAILLFVLPLSSVAQQVFAYNDDADAPQPETVKRTMVKSDAPTYELLVTNITPDHVHRKITCYPMTSQGTLWMKHAHDANLNYELRHENGDAISEGKLELGKPISVHHLPAGVYTIESYDSSNVHVGSFKIVKTE